MKEGILGRIEQRVKKIADNMEKSGFYDYMLYASNTKRFIWRNFLAGMMRGIGAAIGFSVLGALLILLLRALADSSIPYIADFISRIVEIVEEQ